MKTDMAIAQPMGYHTVSSKLDREREDRTSAIIIAKSSPPKGTLRNVLAKILSPTANVEATRTIISAAKIFGTRLASAAVSLDESSILQMAESERTPQAFRER